MAFRTSADERPPGTAPTDRFGLLLVLLIVTFVFTGLNDNPWRLVAAAVNACVLVVAARSTGRTISTKILVALLVVQVVALTFLASSTNEELIGGLAAFAQAAILLAVIVAIVRRLIEHDHVNLQTLAGALCVYVLLGLVFAWFYAGMDGVTDREVLQASAGRADPVYYSFVVLTTVGFGDVTSTIDLVRRVTLVEAMAGQVFLATTIARLMSLFGVRPGPVEP